VKKSGLKPLKAPPAKLSSPMKSAMRAASHALALGGLLVGGAVWTISQQHPLYANPGKLLRLPAAVVDALRARPAGTHVIVTGRDAPQMLIDTADLVTEMRMIKHPYRDQGIAAQPGIEL